MKELGSVSDADSLSHSYSTDHSMGDVIVDV
jgi:hypothetical protein